MYQSAILKTRQVAGGLRDRGIPDGVHGRGGIPPIFGLGVYVAGGGDTTWIFDALNLAGGTSDRGIPPYLLGVYANGHLGVYHIGVYHQIWLGVYQIGVYHHF